MPEYFPRFSHGDPTILPGSPTILHDNPQFSLCATAGFICSTTLLARSLTRSTAGYSLSVYILVSCSKFLYSVSIDCIIVFIQVYHHTYSIQSSRSI